MCRVTLFTKVRNQPFHREIFNFRKFVSFSDAIFESPKTLEDQFWSHRRSPSSIEVKEEILPVPTTISPIPTFVQQNEPQVVPVFHEPQFPTEEQNFPSQSDPILRHNREHDFSTPIPKFRKPYPKEVKQLTVAPGIPIQVSITFHILRFQKAFLQRVVQVWSRVLQRRLTIG
jgi:hypothetical protein